MNIFINYYSRKTRKNKKQGKTRNKEKQETRKNNKKTK
jgi:hypothetical protein